jgi:hypothetical protein
MLSRHWDRDGWLRAAVLLAACVAALGGAVAAELDLVILRDGSEIECRVVELDRDRLTVEIPNDRRRSYAREDVEAIEFGDPAPPKLRARVQVMESDDEVRLYLDGREVAPPSELEAGWFDLGPLLGEGANQLTAEVTSRRGYWAYRWVLEVEGRRETFACGIPNKSGCNRDGRSGKEHGTFPAGSIWLYVDRRSGSVEIGR